MINAVVLLTFGHAFVDVDEGRGAKRREHEHDGERHPHVTDPVDHESLLGSSRSCRLVLPEADQQVRREAHALPADEEHQIVIGQDEQQHRRDEQVEEGEEAAPPLVVRHVTDGIHVDQAANAGDQQHEDDRELVDEQADVDSPYSAGDPVVQRHGDSAIWHGAPEQLNEVDNTDGKGGQRGDRS